MGLSRQDVSDYLMSGWQNGCEQKTMGSKKDKRTHLL